jgi:hypothetical protein
VYDKTSARKKNCLNNLRLELLERGSGVEEVDVAEEHGAAAVALQAEAVHDLARLLALRDALLVLLAQVRDRLAAREAADRDDHGLA